MVFRVPGPGAPLKLSMLYFARHESNGAAGGGNGGLAGCEVQPAQWDPDVCSRLVRWGLQRAVDEF